MWILAVIVIVFILWLFLKNFKTLKIGSLTLFSGGVKTGKTTLAVFVATWELWKARVKWKLRKVFLFKRNEEKPMLYSNIPLNIPEYIELTPEHLKRERRFNYGSIILISEASLFADSQLIKDQDINEQLLLFNKLIGHETKGGKLIYDTQQIQDCHYSIKRSLSSYFFIHHINKYIPFFIVAYVKEYRYSEDNSVIGTEQEDIEDTLKKVVIPKRVWKKFDRYCYSIFTDSLSNDDQVINGRQLPNLKAEHVPSFRVFKGLFRKGGKNEN